MRTYSLPQTYYLVVAAALVVLSAMQIISWQRAVPQVHVFQEGSGPVAVLENTYHQAFLLDTGAGEGVLRDLGETLPWWQRDIKSLVLTSAKSTYAGAKTEVVRRYQISETLQMGSAATPYGTPIHLDPFTLTVYAPGISSVSYRGVALYLASSTPPGTYRLMGHAWTRH